MRMTPEVEHDCFSQAQVQARAKGHDEAQLRGFVKGKAAYGLSGVYQSNQCVTPSRHSCEPGARTTPNPTTNPNPNPTTNPDPNPREMTTMNICNDTLSQQGQ